MLYFDSIGELELWFNYLTEASGPSNRKIGDFYDFTTHILGQGSFGKVFLGTAFKGKSPNKQSEETKVAIKILDLDSIKKCKN